MEGGPVLARTNRTKQVLTIVVYGLMIAAILALWRDDAPQFIYVAF